MSASEAAVRLECSKNKVLRMIDDHRLVGSPKGKKYAHRRVLRSAVEAMAAADKEYNSVSTWLANQPKSIWSSRLGAVLLILDHPAIDDEVRPHICTDPEGIDFREILAGCRAEADIALVMAAQALYDGSADVGFGQLLTVLPPDRLVRVALAIEILAGSIDRWQAFRLLARPNRR